MLRRSFIGLEPKREPDVLETVTCKMEELLCRDDTEKPNQTEAYRNKAATGQIVKE